MPPIVREVGDGKRQLIQVVGTEKGTICVQGKLITWCIIYLEIHHDDVSAVGSARIGFDGEVINFTRAIVGNTIGREKLLACTAAGCSAGRVDVTNGYFIFIATAPREVQHFYRESGCRVYTECRTVGRYQHAIRRRIHRLEIKEQGVGTVARAIAGFNGESNNITIVVWATIGQFHFFCFATVRSGRVCIGNTNRYINECVVS